MRSVEVTLSMWLDGYVAGPDPSDDKPFERTRLTEGKPTTHIRFRVLQ